MRRFAAVAPAGGRSFAAGFCAEGLFSPGVLRRKIFAADGSRGGSCGFRSYRLSKSGACVGRFASTLPHGTAPPGLRACRDACSGFDAPRSVHRGPCIGAMPAGSCVGRFASTLRTGRPPLPGLRVCRDACSGFGAPRGPCIGARASRTVHRSYAGRFLRRSVRVDASARDGRIRCPARSVHRGACIENRASELCRQVLASVGSRRRFRTGRPPGLRACRDACSGFGAPRGPCIGARASRTVHRSYTGRFLRRSVRVDASARDGPPPDFVRAGMRVPDSGVPGCVFRIRCPARSVNRGPCIGGRAVQPVFRGRAVRIGCLPPRCGGGMRRSAPSLSDAGRDRSMTRETAETQRTERAVARNGRIRFGDGAVRFAVGRMGPKRARLRLGRSEYGACRS